MSLPTVCVHSSSESRLLRFINRKSRPISTRPIKEWTLSHPIVKKMQSSMISNSKTSPRLSSKMISMSKVKKILIRVVSKILFKDAGVLRHPLNTHGLNSRVSG